MTPCPFKVGDRVTNRKIGPPICGTVDAVAFPVIMALVAEALAGGIDLPLWRDTYRGSLEGWAVLVMWDNCEAEESAKHGVQPVATGRGRTGNWFPAADIVLFDAVIA